MPLLFLLNILINFNRFEDSLTNVLMTLMPNELSSLFCSIVYFEV